MTATVGWRVSTDFGWFTDMWLEPHRRSEYAALTAELEKYRGQKIGPLERLDDISQTMKLPMYMKDFYRVAFNPKSFAKYPDSITKEQIIESLQVGYRGFDVVNLQGNVLQCAGIPLARGTGPGWVFQKRMQLVLQHFRERTGLEAYVAVQSTGTTFNIPSRKGAVLSVGDSGYMVISDGVFSLDEKRAAVEATLVGIWSPEMNHCGLSDARSALIQGGTSLSSVREALRVSGIRTIRKDELIRSNGSPLPLGQIQFNDLGSPSVGYDGKAVRILGPHIKSEYAGQETSLGKSFLLSRIFGKDLK